MFNSEGRGMKDTGHYPVQLWLGFFEFQIRRALLPPDCVDSARTARHTFPRAFGSRRQAH